MKLACCCNVCIDIIICSCGPSYTYVYLQLNHYFKSFDPCFYCLLDRHLLQMDCSFFQIHFQQLFHTFLQKFFKVHYSDCNPFGPFIRVQLLMLYLMEYSYKFSNFIIPYLYDSMIILVALFQLRLIDFANLKITKFKSYF